MAELGAIASIVGIAAAAAQASRAMYDVATEIQSAGEDVENFAISIDSWSSAMYMAHEALKVHRSRDSAQDDTLGKFRSKKIIKPLVHELKSVTKSIKEFMPRMRTFHEKMSWFARIKWMFMKGEVEKLIRRMESSKSTLAVMLSAINLARNPEGSTGRLLETLLENCIRTAKVQQGRLAAAAPEILKKSVFEAQIQIFVTAEHLLPESRPTSQISIQEASRRPAAFVNLRQQSRPRERDIMPSTPREDFERREPRKRQTRRFAPTDLEPDTRDTQAGPSESNTIRQVAPPNKPAEESLKPETSQVLAPEIPEDLLLPSTFSGVHQTNHRVDLTPTNNAMITGRIKERRVNAMIMPKFSDNLISAHVALNLGLTIRPVVDGEENEPYYFDDGEPEPKIGEVQFYWTVGHGRRFRVRCSVCQRPLPYLIFGASFLERQRQSESEERGAD
ncbi:hypothetical protein PVAG01_00961 [Phlyctema vagabunda]|uniref:Fungal N-terminal domain-containing protein n=1 Tax=Phlyctema vagabunda TaxID=108571 RepID=A0ABR4PVR5_9HELO